MPLSHESSRAGRFWSVVSCTTRMLHAAKRRARIRQARLQASPALRSIVFAPMLLGGRGDRCDLRRQRVAGRSARRRSRCSDLRRPGGDRDPERAPVQRDQGGARAADRHRRGAAGDQQLAWPTRSRCSTRSSTAASGCSATRAAGSCARSRRRWSALPCQRSAACDRELMTRTLPHAARQDASTGRAIRERRIVQIHDIEDVRRSDA